MDPAVDQLLQAARHVRDCQGDSSGAWTRAHVLLYDAVGALETAQAARAAGPDDHPTPAATATRPSGDLRPARRASNWGPTEPSRVSDPQQP